MAYERLGGALPCNRGSRETEHQALNAFVAGASAVRDVREHLQQTIMSLRFQLISGTPLVLDVLGVAQTAWIALDIGQESMPDLNRLGWIPADKSADSRNPASIARVKNRLRPVPRGPGFGPHRVVAHCHPRWS